MCEDHRFQPTILLNQNLYRLILISFWLMSAQCLNPSCRKRCSESSKYCSRDCGMELARERVKTLFIPRLEKFKELFLQKQSKLDADIELLQKEKEETRKEIENQKNCMLELDNYLTEIRSITVTSNKSDPSIQEGPTSNPLTFCFTCGVAIRSKTSVRHFEKCFKKTERSMSYGSLNPNIGNFFCNYYDPHEKLYCRRLKSICYEHQKFVKQDPDEVCGSPLHPWPSESSSLNASNMCCVSNTQCCKHLGWVQIKKATIEQKIYSLALREEELNNLEQSLKDRIKQNWNIYNILRNDSFESI